MTLDTKKLLMIGAVVVACTQIGNGLKAMSYLVAVPEVAYAGQAKAEEVKSDFDRYIEQQQEEAKLEKQRIELQEEFNKKLVDIQQQQAPNQMYQPQPVIERYWDEQEQRYYCDDGQQLYWADQEGHCDG